MDGAIYFMHFLSEKAMEWVKQLHIIIMYCDIRVLNVI